MTHKNKNDLQIIRVRMIRLKSGKSSKWEIMFPLSIIFSTNGITNLREEILSIINKTIKDLNNLISENQISKSKPSQLYLAGKIILDTKKKIMKKYGIDITNFMDMIADNLKICKRNINYVVQLYKTLKEKDIDNSIPWTVYKQSISTVDKKKSREVLNLYKNGKLKSSTDVKKYVKKLNESYKK